MLKEFCFVGVVISFLVLGYNYKSIYGFFFFWDVVFSLLIIIIRMIINIFLVYFYKIYLYCLCLIRFSLDVG